MKKNDDKSTRFNCQIITNYLFIHLTIESCASLPTGYNKPGDSEVAEVQFFPVILYFDANFKAAAL